MSERSLAPLAFIAGCVLTFGGIELFRWEGVGSLVIRAMEIGVASAVDGIAAVAVVYCAVAFVSWIVRHFRRDRP